MTFDEYWKTREDAWLKSGLSKEFIDRERELKSNWSDRLSFQAAWDYQQKKIDNLSRALLNILEDLNKNIGVKDEV